MATRKKHTPEQVVRKLAAADREPPPRTYTTWTAVAPDLVFTVLTYGPSPLCGPPLVRNLSSPASKLAGHRAAPSDTPESCPSQVTGRNEGDEECEAEGRARIPALC